MTDFPAAPASPTQKRGSGSGDPPHLSALPECQYTVNFLGTNRNGARRWSIRLLRQSVQVPGHREPERALPLGVIPPGGPLRRAVRRGPRPGDGRRPLRRLRGDFSGPTDRSFPVPGCAGTYSSGPGHARGWDACLTQPASAALKIPTCSTRLQRRGGALPRGKLDALALPSEMRTPLCGIQTPLHGPAQGQGGAGHSRRLSVELVTEQGAAGRAARGLRCHRSELHGGGRLRPHQLPAAATGHLQASRVGHLVRRRALGGQGASCLHRQGSCPLPSSRARGPRGVSAPRAAGGAMAPSSGT